MSTIQPFLITLTRQSPANRAWCQILEKAYPQALLLEWALIQTQALDDPILQHALQQAQQRYADYHAHWWVSPAAVQYFLDDTAHQWWSDQPEVWMVGEGTARALRHRLADLGLPLPKQWVIATPTPTHPLADSEGLWQTIQPRLSDIRHLQVIRGQSAHHAALGGDGRDWLIQQCQSMGMVIDKVAAYRRTPTPTPAPWVNHPLPLQPSIWVFFSRQTVMEWQRLQQIQWSLDWHHQWLRWCAHGYAFAIHPKISQAVLQLGFAQCQTIQPDPLALVEQLRHCIPAPPLEGF